MKFIIGIGNPEQQYEKTRHNVGFRALDVWCKNRSGVWRDKKKYRSRIASFDSFLLIKPETYVNNTGDAVSSIQRKYESAPADFLFVCDDVNLIFGKIRLREAGGAGGHHGLESVATALGTEDFPRLRIGVGSEAMSTGDLTDFVLQLFTAEEEKKIGGILEKAAAVCESWVSSGFDGARTCLSRLQSVQS